VKSQFATTKRIHIPKVLPTTRTDMFSTQGKDKMTTLQLGMEVSLAHKMSDDLKTEHSARG